MALTFANLALTAPGIPFLQQFDVDVTNPDLTNDAFTITLSLKRVGAGQVDPVYSYPQSIVASSGPTHYTVRNTPLGSGLLKLRGDTPIYCEATITVAGAVVQTVDSKNFTVTDLISALRNVS